tara:strand:- start:1555 stop:1713 length:159 start_codon:yes stop_codon:yes gene_type:complete
LEISRLNLGFIKFGGNKNSKDELFLFRFFGGQKNEKYQSKTDLKQKSLIIIQ